ncbi:FAD-dependent oxidoreductase [Sinomicrobium weinanense]|uniref:FAD-dependent oxidoreductase n=1 Tax=Sinomicrobium weinanense TaxID=2842200 RepID=A0A926JTL9_9FLAO|nr:FAD-dependent oxidoreductase [Sinomicrobium weinanense]MBC9797149.1 FAD-dependent oxidoreductase [Sinomicrobium weinanense]MBU3124490.1 FAD-dependent oxidoreductase [Sinomicrobium weinanense]
MKQVGLDGFRELKTLELHYELIVVGGGLSGVCAALTASREGVKVALVQDRPVLGGNASSEVRLWALGATSHMGNNNRWAREGGVVDEIMVENTYKNKEGNPVIFDTILIDKVLDEPHIDLYLNTAVFSTVKSGESRIEKVIAFNSQNSTLYHFSGNYFIDASGDGIMAYQAGVPYRIGSEAPGEFDELLAPDVEDYGELLGHTLFFYSKKQEQKVQYIAPDFALKDMGQVPRVKNVKVGEDGCKLWWFEYGGRRDTVHETEEIKKELWKVVYGIWNHIKNSGDYEGADYYTLEWVGLIPGKRESRRFEGHFMLTQKDVIEQREHYDAISYGGWALDLHPADGIYSDKDGCTQWHARGVYAIPYRCYVPLGMDNLLLTGRIISVSHVAFGSTRVMATCAHGGQAVGMAVALSLKKGIPVKAFMEPDTVKLLQNALLGKGHYIPGIKLSSGYNLAEKAHITTSGTLQLEKLQPDGNWQHLEFSMGQMIPVEKKIPAVKLWVKAEEATTLSIELRVSSKPYNHTPDVLVDRFSYELIPGEQSLDIQTGAKAESPRYLFLCLMANPQVSVALTDRRLSGIVSVFNSSNPAVSNFGKQTPPEGLGVDEFEFWCPKRRPAGANMAFELSFPITLFSEKNLVNGFFRPVHVPNAWVAGLEEKEATVDLQWEEPQTIKKIRLFFDPDYDHPMETVQMNHAENYMPFLIRNYELYAADVRIAEVSDNYQTINEIVPETPLNTDRLTLKLKQNHSNVPVSVIGIVCE